MLDRNLDCENIKVCRKRKDLRHGDFVVPRGVLKIDSNVSQERTLRSSLCCVSTCVRNFCLSPIFLISFLFLCTIH